MKLYDNPADRLNAIGGVVFWGFTLEVQAEACLAAFELCPAASDCLSIQALALSLLASHALPAGRWHKKRSRWGFQTSAPSCLPIHLSLSLDTLRPKGTEILKKLPKGNP